MLAIAGTKADVCGNEVTSDMNLVKSCWFFFFFSLVHERGLLMKIEGRPVLTCLTIRIFHMMYNNHSSFG